jgi:hypothetical protein
MPTLEDNALVFRFPKSARKAKFSVDFQRTLRIPDSDKDYPLPPGLGRFPLRHVEDYPNLPAQTRQRGGIVLPVWQSEAIWLNFNGGSRSNPPFAIKVAAGKINAVTGEQWTTPLNRNPQDYMVCPDQPWLDGFAIAPGVIRQFVAMPLGEGYSVEEQLTGEAEWGGLQISVTPMRREAWERRQEPVVMGLEERSDSFPMTPMASAEMSLGAGGRMQQVIEEDPYDLEDWDMRATQRVFVTLWHASRWKDLTGEAAPDAAPSAQDYARAGLPWYAHYASDQNALPGSAALGSVRSVADLHKDKTGATLPGSQDVAPGPVVQVAPDRTPDQDTPREVKSDTSW